MGIIDRIRGNPFSNLKKDQLTEEKIKLERRERLLSGEMRDNAEKQKYLIADGFGKSDTEKRILARKIDQLDKKVKLKNIQLKRLSDQIKIVDNLVFVLENQESLKKSGLMTSISKVPKSKLENFLGKVNLKEALEESKITGVREILEREYGLVGEIEDDASTRALMEVWDAKPADSPASAFETWLEKRGEIEESNNE